MSTQKIAVLATTAVTAVTAFAANSFAAVYTIDNTALTAVGSGAKDIADSSVGVTGQLMPVLVPLIVVGFVIGMILYFVKRR